MRAAAGISGEHTRQVGRRSKHAYAAEMLQREIRLESRVELARCVIARPYGVIVHADGDDAARKTSPLPSPIAPAAHSGQSPRGRSALSP